MIGLLGELVQSGDDGAPVDRSMGSDYETAKAWEVGKTDAFPEQVGCLVRADSLAHSTCCALQSKRDVSDRGVVRDRVLMLSVAKRIGMNLVAACW